MTPLHIVFVPLLTPTAGAVGAAAPLVVIMAEGGVATDAFLRARVNCGCTDISTPPFSVPRPPLAAIHALTVVREDKEKEEQEQ